ncbi:hypothetical protein BJV74DRAFT_861458 [Russula compacta]|nr:hypothetical protein BJV74DRAFT_861458 [Russula compacta]
MLEALTVIYDFPTKYHEATRRDDSIELPFLRELVLGEADSPWCSYFLGRITFPTASRVELKFGYDYGGSEGQELISWYLRQRFQDSWKASGYLALLGRDFGIGIHIHATSSASVPLDSELEASTQAIRDAQDADCRPIDLNFRNRMHRPRHGMDCFKHWAGLLQSRPWSFPCRMSFTVSAVCAHPRHQDP